MRPTLSSSIQQPAKESTVQPPTQKSGVSASKMRRMAAPYALPKVTSTPRLTLATRKNELDISFQCLPKKPQWTLLPDVDFIGHVCACAMQGHYDAPESPTRTPNLQASPQRTRAHVVYALNAPATQKKLATISLALAIRLDAEHGGSRVETTLTSMATSSSPLGIVGSNTRRKSFPN
jgi:hypothetical protein